MSFSFSATVRRSRLHDVLKAKQGTWLDPPNARAATHARHAAIVLAGANEVEGDDDPVFHVSISGHANANGVHCNTAISVAQVSDPDETELAAELEAEGAALGVAVAEAAEAELAEEQAEQQT